MSHVLSIGLTGVEEKPKSPEEPKKEEEGPKVSCGGRVLGNASIPCTVRLSRLTVCMERLSMAF